MGGWHDGKHEKVGPTTRFRNKTMLYDVQGNTTFLFVVKIDHCGKEKKKKKREKRIEDAFNANNFQIVRVCPLTNFRLKSAPLKKKEGRKNIST